MPRTRTVVLVSAAASAAAAAVLAVRRGPAPDLLQVDVSRVVSRWLGETEKALRRVFDRAERKDAVLFADEADDLFDVGDEDDEDDD